MRQNHELAAFYAKEASPLERAVAAAVNTNAATIEDACSYAWAQLLAHVERIELGQGAYWWLYRTAVREAWRQCAIRTRQLPVGAALEVAERGREDRHVLAPILEERELLESIAQLRPRQRRMITMHLLGFTYAEIARITGDTVRTVERQLLRGRRALNVARGE